MSATVATKRAFILSGEGIECEREAERCFRQPELGFTTEFWPVTKLIDRPKDFTSRLQAGDWIIFPGGFSFADHFGSGKLLSFEMARAGLFEAFRERGVNLMGMCNGFQVLVEAGLFGQGVKLLHNEREGRRIGFVNRWIRCESPLLPQRPLRIPVRHGEGRLTRPEGRDWETHVKPILFYADPDFSNGSVENVAGLEASFGRGRVIAMMPHPEIALRPLDDPDSIGAETFLEHRGALLKAKADGLMLLEVIVSPVAERNTRS